MSNNGAQGGVGIHLSGQKGARNGENAEKVSNGSVIGVEVTSQ